MIVGDLTKMLSVFYHIVDTDRVLIQVPDADGAGKCYELSEVRKAIVEGRTLPVLIPGEVEVTRDTFRGRIASIPMNGSISWLCSRCGNPVDDLDRFCRQCGLRLE